MNKIKFISLTASLVLATTLTLSCEDKEKDKPATDTASTAAAQSPTAETFADSVRVIDKTCFILVYPEHDENYVDETGDFGFYTGNALGRFEEIGLETMGITIGEKERYLSFALDGGKTHVIDLKDSSSTVQALLYKKGNKPIDIGIDTEQPVASYLGTISKYLGMKPIELMKKAGITHGSFRDSRDDSRYYGYDVVLIGEQIWMSQNLAYAAAGSKCYGHDESKCQQYGRLYDWETAKKACPAGMHLPSDVEWATLLINIGGAENAGKKLKSKDGWDSVWGDNAAGEYTEFPGGGSDDYGFSALPGGYESDPSNGFRYAGTVGYYWMSTEEDDDKAKAASMNNLPEGYGDVLNFHGSRKDYKYSVRCVAD
jgi:uncharacterized protein (TIGR02145 family)